MALSLPDVERNLSLALSREPLFAPHASTAFEIVETLGQGGMGTVYAVRDRRNGRLAALKLLQRGESEGLDQARFLREALLTARLNHPGIPPVHELGQTARGELFLLMRRIEGRTLDAEIAEVHKKGASEGELRRLVQALVKVGEALCYAHSQGVIHRDVKPSNIMLGRYGEVLLLDWGVAKDQRSASSEGLLPEAISKSKLEGAGLTLAGALVGTPGYMAPEQARGEDVDERADVYALGLVLGEVLSGRPLVGEGNALARLIANCEGRILPPKLALPRSLSWVLGSALQVDREARTASVQELTSQLEAWLADEAIPGYPRGLVESGVRLVRKRPARILGLTAGTLVLGLAIQVGSSWWDMRRAALRVEEGQREAARASAIMERTQLALERLDEARRAAGPEALTRRRACIKEALEKLDFSEHGLLMAAALLTAAGDNEEAERILTDCAERHKPAYEALFELHRLILGKNDFARTVALKELLARAEARGDENEFTLFFAGYERYQADDFAAAIELFSQAIKLNSGVAFFFRLRGSAQRQAKNLGAALADYDRALALEPDSASFCHFRGDLKREMGDLEGAAADLDRAIELNPRDPESYQLRSGIRYERGDYKGTLEDLNKALDQTVSDELYYNRGLVKKNLNDDSGAIEDYRRALELNPRFGSARNALIRVFLDTDRPDSANAEIDKAIKLEGCPDSVLDLRSRLRLILKDFEGAERDVSKHLELKPRDIDAWLSRSKIRERRRDLAGARSDLNSALEVDPKNLQTLCARGDLLLEMGLAEDAWGDFGQAVSLAPQNKEVYRRRALARYRVGNKAGALLDFDTILLLDQGDTEAYISRGAMRRLVGDSEGARADYDQALVLDPMNLRALYNRGNLRSAQNDLEGAWKDYSEALRIKPNEVDPRFSRALVYARKGDPRSALEDFNEVLRLSPDYHDARSNAAVMKKRLGDLPGALRDFDLYLKSCPEAKETYVSRAEVRSQLGDLLGARADYSEAIRRGSKDLRARIGRGKLALAAGDRAAAQRDFEEFLKHAAKDDPDAEWVRQQMSAIAPSAGN
jgi:tetratricopeptide (TPR) repeat protein